MSTATALTTSTADGTGLCVTCQVKPKYFDSSANKLHPYCGKTCAEKAKTQGVVSLGPGGGALCIVCQRRPQYVEGTRVHPYCGKACAAKAKQGNVQPPVPVNNQNLNTCQTPGCTRPRWNNTKYCSVAHKDLGKTECLMCHAAPKQGRSHFCGRRCADTAQNMAVMLLEVPEEHETFVNVAEQFTKSWRHSSRCPAVKHVFKIVAQKSSVDQYEAYKQSVELRGNFVAQGRHAGNENRRWHGTTRTCTLGEGGNIRFCTYANCSLCSIIKTSFDVAKGGKKFAYGRFGLGIYVSSTSSKSNDYSSNTHQNASLKAILLNKVVVGKGCRKTSDEPSLRAPPAGYDSVLAETGRALNHDECIVYTNDAIRPSFLVMYA